MPPNSIDFTADIQHQLYSAQWYVIGGIAVACLAFVAAVTVVAYKCYRKYTPGGGSETRPLSAAIRKGLMQDTVSCQINKTSSLRKSNKVDEDGGGGQRSNKRGSVGSRSPTSGFSPSSTQCYIEDETKPGSPTEKEAALRETAEDELKLPKLGTLSFSVEYDATKSALLVTILRANDLPIKDPTVGSSDPYLKLQLLPDKRHKVKTRVLRKTLNPVYDEIFTFYGLSANQLQGITLHFVVLSFDRFSRDDIIGEVVYPLTSADLGERDKELTVTQDISPRLIRLHNQGRGELLVSLCYQPAANRLTAVVLKARNLPKMDITGLSDPYVKMYLLYNGQRIAKKKTHVKKRTLNPVFNESFLFDLPCNEGLANISLEFLVLDWDRVTKNEVVGRLEVGAKFGEAEAHHWNEVMNCPRKQIADWHKLRD